VVLDFTRLDAMRAMIWSAVVNGIIAVPVMAITVVAMFATL
jgi:hypothetical protein